MKQKKSHTLALHIGTAFVEGCMMSVEADTKTPSFIDKVERVAIGFGSTRVRNALLQHTNIALKKLLEKYANEKVTSVKIALSSPWYHASVRTIHSSSEKSVPVTQESILRTVQKYQDQEPPKPGREDLEAVAVQVRVNGYPTALHSNAIKGKLVTIHLYESEIDSDIKKTFFETVGGVFPHSRVALYSFPLVCTLGLREVSEEGNFIVVEIGAEVSDVVIVHKDTVEYLATIPIGYYTMARLFDVTKNEDSLADSLSKLALYARDELSVEEKTKVKEGIDTIFADWRKEFSAILKKASSHTPVPRKIFLLTDKNQAGWINKGIQYEAEHSHTIETLTQSNFQDLVKIGETGTHSANLSLLAIFFNMAVDDIFGSSDAKTYEAKKGIFAKEESFD